MSEFCESCTAPLSRLEFKGKSERYCKHCTDASGKLLAKEQVQQGIAHWLMSWQTGVTEKQALDRAGHFMRAMPAWAEKK